jgi:DNA-binding NarL/FixJ family response regulator
VCVRNASEEAFDRSRDNPMARPIRVAVVGPYPLLVEGIVQTIYKCPELELIAKGANRASIRGVLQKGQLDVLIVDNATPSIQPILADLLRRSDCNTLVLTALDDPLRELAVGASGYILKNVNGADLVTAVKTVHSGHVVTSPELACEIVRSTRQHVSLDYRERQILKHVSEGLSNKEVAEVVGLSLGTVKMYVQRIFRKLRVHNRIEAMQAWKNNQGK